MNCYDNHYFENNKGVVTPAKAGVYSKRAGVDSRFRGNDSLEQFSFFVVSI